jgi:hypothetical protein
MTKFKGKRSVVFVAVFNFKRLITDGDSVPRQYAVYQHGMQGT